MTSSSKDRALSIGMRDSSVCFIMFLCLLITETDMHQEPTPCSSWKKGFFFAPRQYLSKSPGIYVVAPIALLLLGVLYHGDGMSTVPLCTKALGAESIHEVFFFSYEVSMTTKEKWFAIRTGWEVGHWTIILRLVHNLGWVNSFCCTER